MTVRNEWQGKRVLITGGSSGLGKELALQAAHQGAKVVIVARRLERLQEVIQGTDIRAIQADVSDKEAIYRITGEALAHLGGVDVLFNNASALGPTPMPLLLDTDCEDLADVLETNLIGPFRLTKALLPSMLLQQKGLVINISSDASQSAYPTWGAYSVSKAALDHLTKVWRAELSEHGISFVAIDPGDMYTPMHLEAIPDANRADLYEPNDVARELLTFLSQPTYIKEPRYTASQWREQARQEIRMVRENMEEVRLQIYKPEA